MKAIIQRVKRASVSVDGALVSSVERGVCVLIGIERHDQDVDQDYIVRKILNTKLFPDESGSGWRKSVKDLGLEILCVSQFTLYAVLKGNNLDFHKAMPPEKARVFYDSFLDKLRRTYYADKVKDGAFGEYMQVNIENDGPVTLQLESKKNEE